MTVNPEGLLVLNKPVGMTSREAVDRASLWFPRSTRIGHTGTLDPLASGVLVLCVGSATRLVEHVQAMSKVYRSTFRLGAVSTTEDGEGTITPHPEASDPGAAAVYVALQSFVGTINQVPPAFSAARIEGKRAHALARKGTEVALSPRQVQIHRIDLMDYTYPDVEVEIHCGKGTYIRSLARDVGDHLGVGAYVHALHRVQVGPFRDVDGVPFEVPAQQAMQRLLPREQALSELPRLVISAEQAARMRQGQKLALAIPDEVSPGELAVFEASGRMVGVALWRGPGSLVRPTKIVS